MSHFADTSSQKVPIILPAVLLIFFWGCIALPWTEEEITYERPGRMVGVILNLNIIITMSQFLDNLWWLAPGLLGYIFNWYRRRFMAPAGADGFFTCTGTLNR